MSSKQEKVNRTLITGPGQLVHRLPVEILIQIFLFCLPVKTLSLPTFASQKKTSLLLRHVCYSWRQTALQTPGLWTSLVVNVSLEDSLLVPERFSQIASFWSSQAECHLINLEVSSLQKSDYLNWEILPQLRGSGLEPERIRSLHLSFEDVYDICCFLQFQDGEDIVAHYIWSFPNLEAPRLKPGISASMMTLST